MHRGERLAAGFAQNAGGVHHRVDAGEARQPVLDVGVTRQIAGHERQVFEPPVRTARRAYHLVPGGRQGGDDVGTDKAVQTDDEDAQADWGLFFLGEPLIKSEVPVRPGKAGQFSNTQVFENWSRAKMTVFALRV